MRKFFSLLLGMGFGALLGALLAVFFSPLSSEELRANWEGHYRRAVEAGRRAREERRSELEESLVELGEK